MRKIAIVVGIILVSLSALVSTYIGTQVDVTKDSIPRSMIFISVMMIVGLILLFENYVENEHFMNFFMSLIIGGLATFMCLLIGTFFLMMWGSLTGRLIVLVTALLIIGFSLYVGIRKLVDR